MTEAEAFAWYMPGDPPPAPSPTEGCWEWAGQTYSNGYGFFFLNRKPIRATHVAYRIYRGTLDEGQFILHSCDRPICVQPAHLHPGTQQDNMDEKVERGRHDFGERHGMARLTADDVRWIRAQEGMSQKALAEMFGVSRGHISLIRTGRTWKHLL